VSSCGGGFLLKMKDDGLAKSFGMRERGCGLGMRMHSSSNRTPLDSTARVVAAMIGDVGGSIVSDEEESMA
jgi:hypothetical protein